ncbi:MAG: hypothetical protein Q9195_002134 [Heterodermia aff. obscurata]
MTTPIPVDTPAPTNTPVPVNTPVPANNPVTPNTAVLANTPASANLCGNDQHIIIDGTPWLVANSMYGAAQMVGSVCTQFDRVETPAGGNPRIVWGSKTAIEYVESTNNVAKGYTNIGLIQNLQTTISSIASVPATYDWTRTETSPFKGNICFDFILSPTKGDSTSTSAQELMLWLQYEGGQLPIGWDRGPAATIPALFGTSWKLYEDINTGNGMTVHSLLPDTQFSGSFTGDLKEWFEALVQLGRLSEGSWVNIGNAG